MNRLEIVNLYLKDTFEFLEENEFFEDVSNEDGVDDIKKFKECKCNHSLWFSNSD